MCIKSIFVILLSMIVIFGTAEQLLAATEITGQVWDGNGGPFTLAGSPYFSKSGIPVPKDKTLTIHPGVEVRSGTGMWGVSVEGTLIAKGTATQKITFTCDGEQKPGNWSGILFSEKGTGILDHCKIIYGGNRFGGNITCQGDSTPIISNCQISYSSVDGIRAEDKSRPRVVNCLISNNVRAAYIWPATANFDDFSGNTVRDNKLNAIRLSDPPAGFEIYENVTLRNFNVPYSAGVIIINKGAKLTIEPGVIIKFDGDPVRETTGHITIYDGGVLEARGLPCEPIVFTYINDDIGGDTNGDGTASAPQKGMWNGITFQNGSSGVVEYCKILYAGHPWSRGLACEGNASPTISNCEFSHIKGHAVFMRNDANPVVSPNNMFTDITISGVWNDGSRTINATNNWWGSVSGPRHKSNPGGGPIQVSDKVNFTPYLTGLPNYSNSICLSGRPGGYTCRRSFRIHNLCLGMEWRGTISQGSKCPIIPISESRKAEFCN